MVQKESWERESKECIDYCLECTIPANLCTGKGKCKQYAKRRRRRGQFELEVLELAKKNYTVPIIARKLDVAYERVYRALGSLRSKGLITDEQFHAAFKQRRKD